jgi:hypothetical protein
MDLKKRMSLEGMRFGVNDVANSQEARIVSVPLDRLDELLEGLACSWVSNVS